MRKPAEILIERIDQRLSDLGKSRYWLSREITDGKQDTVIRDIDRKKSMPNGSRLQAIAEKLDTTTEYLLGETGDSRQVPSEVSLRDVNLDWGAPDPENGIPLVGTGDCGDLVVTTIESGEELHIERSSFDPDYHVKFIERPPALRMTRGVYAIYFHGDSMEPRFYAGEIGLVYPAQPPRPGDYVLVQLRDRDGEDVSSVLVKKLVARRGGKVVLEQHNPAATFELPLDRVKHLHRILSPSALLGV